MNQGRSTHPEGTECGRAFLGPHTNDQPSYAVYDSVTHSICTQDARTIINTSRATSDNATQDVGKHFPLVCPPSRGEGEKVSRSTTRASLQSTSYSRRTQATVCVSQIQVTERVVRIGY